jgi:hypothetical protein
MLIFKLKYTQVFPSFSFFRILEEQKNILVREFLFFYPFYLKNGFIYAVR